MAYASISGTVLYVSGLTVGQQYAMALYCMYPGTTYYSQVARQPGSGTVAAGTTTWSFNISSYVGNAGTYNFYVNVYAPGQKPQNTQTNIVSYTTQAPVTYTTVTGYCGTGMSSFRMSSSRGAYQTVTATSGGIQSMQVVSGDTVNFTQLNPLDGYGAPYSLYYNRSGQSGWFGPATTFDITDTSFDRRIMITATELAKPTAPYITDVSTTQNSATVYWNSNGADGTTGYWTLFYRTATGADISYGNVSSSPVTVTGLSPGTTYYFKVRHTVNGSYLDSSYVSATTLAPVSPTITSVTTTKDSATVYWNSNGGAAGYWTLFYRTISGAYVSYGNVSSSPVTITGLAAGTTYYFMVRHTLGGSYADSSSVSATTKNPIALFYWTSDDSSKIKAGELITNITATAWNNLISKIAACGGSTASIPTATSGGNLTAEHFNQMRNSISGLTGAGTVVSAVTKGTKILATMFANSTTALKESINRAINTKNS